MTDGLNEADRGKLIMACGTGKTFTALKIAEAIAPTGHVLFLVPSLSLLSQTLREWTAESENPIHSLAVCSDINVGKRREKNADDVGDITIHDLAFPATTNAKQLVAQYDALKATAKKAKESPRLTVVFSTYQSIEAVSKAQKAGLPDFDLIICDEAHRTTGVTLSGEDESGFVKVHDAKFLKASKRLYMTATPRIYGDEAKTKAKEATAELASMDDEALFGKELHRLGFGEAVGKSLLSDYKVLVLAVDEKYVSKTFQHESAGITKEMPLEDATKITGCWNGLEKRFEAAKSNVDLHGDLNPMRRAVAFSRSIKDSKKFVEQFGQIVAAYKQDHPDAQLLEIEPDHVDGTFDALRRGALLDWLKAESPANTCRILFDISSSLPLVLRQASRYRNALRLPFVSPSNNLSPSPNPFVTHDDDALVSLAQGRNSHMPFCPEHPSDLPFLHAVVRPVLRTELAATTHGTLRCCSLAGARQARTKPRRPKTQPTGP